MQLTFILLSLLNLCFCCPASPVVVLLTEEVVIGVRGRNVTLDFAVIGDEPRVLASSIRWYLNGVEELIGDERLSFSPDRLSLTITNLSQADEGTYMVNATNIIGTGTAVVSLDVESKMLNDYFVSYGNQIIKWRLICFRVPSDYGDIW